MGTLQPRKARSPVSQLQKKDRIFVVDDDPIITTTLGLILSQQVFDVTPFTGPLEALEATQTETPNLLIADVMMPGSSGIELAIALREACPACAVILFSGQPATETMLETARIRGHDFQVLAKPVHPIEILARIRSALKLDSSDDESKASLQS